MHYELTKAEKSYSTLHQKDKARMPAERMDQLWQVSIRNGSEKYCGADDNVLGSMC